MLFRFSLYGFLKNLRFFESFLILALLDRDLDFAAIGWLVAVREITVTACEVPSGAVADSLGRRRCMVASMAAYVASALLLALSQSYALLVGAMLAQGLGDAFRSGTHKAMIDAWLRQQGRADERSRVYGFTRSWSKIGSAVSALCGGLLLVAGADYRGMFLASAVVALLNLVNLATYPKGLDLPPEAVPGSLRGTLHALREALREVVAPGRLRGLLVSSSTALGTYEVARDYLQPVLQTLALAIPIGVGLRDEARVGLAVGVVSAVMFLLAGAASRRSHRVESRLGGADRAARSLMLGQVACYGVVGVGLAFGIAWCAVLAFVAMGILHNFWRPVQMGRVADASDAARTATVMSIESQASALVAALCAPAIGLSVDLLAEGRTPTPLGALAPVGLVAVPLLLSLWAERGRPSASVG